MDLVAWATDAVTDVLAGPFPQRFAHVIGVGSRARLAAPLFDRQDQELLVAAALLHDIGYAPNLAHTTFHPLDGARFLAHGHADSRLCALVAHHSCAYLEAELRGLSAQLAQWVDERTPLRDALWWADMTTTPDGESTNVHDRIEEIQKRYGPDDLVTFFIRQAKPELVAAVERTEERLRAAGVDYTAK
ncbi:HD domain-containing protein [Lentzea albidocapillata]|uniref:HD domain-containing protein n=1 Tax=Lentzea albidocapillata TaxID=40571 RepID=UPI000B7DF0D8|nr:HD domain-containing protein [Lentzea albidocapillata]